MMQTSIFDECFVDSFAGGGGASTGIELATGHPIDIAINHNEAAIMMHQRNHPFTEHYIEDIWAVDPKAAVRGRHVKLAWFSPDCKHFSRAKGSALVDKKIRGLAWVVLKWAAAVRPDVIMLENVPEFVTWGPVRKGKPVKSKAGQTYEKWLSQLKALGYEVETRKICAADVGAPTIRTRFHLVARCDGKPIVWPKRTHAPRDSEEVKSGKLLPWRSAAEIINWDLECPSIFATKAEIKEKYGINAIRPLRDNTLRRIAKGLDKFVLKNAEPFIVPVGYGEKKGQTPRTHDPKEPLSTVVSSTKQYVCDPVMTPYSVECNHGGERQARGLEDPLNTVTGKFTGGVASPVMTPFHMHNHSNAVGTDVREPVNTVTGVGAQMVIEPVCTPYIMCNNAGNAPHEVGEPTPTITTGNRNFVVAPHLIQYHSEQSSKEVRGQKINEPIQTVDAANRYGLTATYLTEYYGNGRDGISVKDPMQTITAKDRECITMAHLAHFKGKDKGQHPLDPLMTITARDGQFADVRTMLVKWDGHTDLGYWPEVRKMLNKYCDYNIAENEILIISILGIWYFISDIGLRMLSPRELYDAMGFPHDYIIDKDINGNAITRTDQVARCGNAVCPAVAEALTRANLPECCKQKIEDMAQLREVMVG